MQTLELHLHQGVATIWLNRPEKHNALNPQMMADIASAFDLFQHDKTVRVIVLKGKGPSFCAGADLHYMKEIAGFGQAENLADAQKLAALFETIYRCPKPVLAVVHGAVYGGANGLTAACDIVLAESQTVFAFSEVKLGITPATISPYVIRRCGEAPARELMLTGRRFSASEAARFLLVNKVAPQAEMDEQEHFYVSQLMTSAPQAVEQCKKLIENVATGLHQNESLNTYTTQLIASQRASAEAQEGMTAFFEKRKPNWVKPS